MAPEGTAAGPGARLGTYDTRGRPIGPVRTAAEPATLLPDTVSMTFDSAKAKGTMLGATFGASAVPIGIVIAPDSRTAFVANANIDAVTVVDIARREIVGYLKTGREPDGMAWVKRK